MKRFPKLMAAGAITIASAALMLTVGPQEVTAADHADAPGAIADPAADIADLYAWHDGKGTITAILTFAGDQAPGAAAAYDSDVLYTLHIDNTGTLAGQTTYDQPLDSNSNDNESDLQIHIRFGQNGNDAWGVQVENLPGGEAIVSGPVDTAIDGTGGTQVQTGVFDDPFFFDLDGFQTTLANLQDDKITAELAFASLAKDGMPIDSLAGSNTHAIVLQFNAETAANGGELLQLWATSGRITAGK